MEQGRGPWAQAGFSKTDVDKAFFSHPGSMHFLLFLLCCVLFPYSFVLSLPCLPLHPAIQHARKLWGRYSHTCSTHTEKHASFRVRPLKALRQQKQQAVVCGLIALSGRRIIELDMSDRSVSGTKCTDEFLAAVTMALIYRLFWRSLACFIAQ